jgi:hypothetical protein
MLKFMRSQLIGESEQRTEGRVRLVGLFGYIVMCLVLVCSSLFIIADMMIVLLVLRHQTELSFLAPFKGTN